MWIAVKGTIVGFSLFAIGAAVFLLAFFRSKGPLVAAPGQHWMMDINVITHLTIYNAWFWAAFVASLVIGYAIVLSWPGKFSPVFWVVLFVIDLIPIGALGLFLVLTAKLKQVSGQ